MARQRLVAVDLFQSTLRKRSGCQVLNWFTGKPPAVYEDPTFRSFEQNAVVRVVPDCEFDTIGIDSLDIKFGRRVVAVAGNRITIS